VYRALLDPAAVQVWMVPDGMTSQVTKRITAAGPGVVLTVLAPDRVPDVAPVLVPTGGNISIGAALGFALHAFRGLAGLRNRERPRVWLTTILRNCYYDRCRAEHEADETLGRDHDAAFDLFDTIVEEDPFPYSDRVHLEFLELFDDEKIIDVFGRLHPAYREALILAYVYGYKAREIAEITGAALGTVLARLSRGRRQLERELWEYARGKKLIPEGETRA
jgi:RNA polymerase sigma-70 factor (ECF subfamily)